MKFLIPLTYLLVIAVAEPPVSYGYASSRSGHNHDHLVHDHSHHGHSADTRKSLPQEYGVPVFGARSQKYEAPAARNAHIQQNDAPSLRKGLSGVYGRSKAQIELSPEYDLPVLSQVYDAPLSVGGLSPNHKLPSARIIPDTYIPSDTDEISDSYITSITLSNEPIPSISYDLPHTDSIFDYHNAVSHSGYPSDKVSKANPSRLSISEEHSIPAAKASLPSIYSAPKVSVGRSFSSHNGSTFGTLSTSYDAPSSRFVLTSHDNSVSKTAPDNHSKKYKPISKTHAAFDQQSSLKAYEAPKANSFRNTHVIPADKGLLDTDEEPKARGLSGMYGASAARRSSDAYKIPAVKSLSQEYGVPSSRAAGFKTSAFVSTFDAVRSSPSLKYGTPTTSEVVIEDQHNVFFSPDHIATNILDDINQEPASYDFTYKVSDLESGSDFGHSESRKDNKAEGSYFVVLPDGTKQVVEYEADERGFQPRISIEPADYTLKAEGYDDEVQDQARSGHGYY